MVDLTDEKSDVIMTYIVELYQQYLDLYYMNKKKYICKSIKGIVYIGRIIDINQK